MIIAHCTLQDKVPTLPEDLECWAQTVNSRTTKSVKQTGSASLIETEAIGRAGSEENLKRGIRKGDVTIDQDFILCMCCSWHDAFVFECL